MSGWVFQAAGWAPPGVLACAACSRPGRCAPPFGSIAGAAGGAEAARGAAARDAQRRRRVHRPLGEPARQGAGSAGCLHDACSPHPSRAHSLPSLTRSQTHFFPRHSLATGAGGPGRRGAQGPVRDARRRAARSRRARGLLRHAAAPPPPHLRSPLLASCALAACCAPLPSQACALAHLCTHPPSLHPRADMVAAKAAQQKRKAAEKGGKDAKDAKRYKF